MTADQLIRTLGLQPHPKEGGHFRETYRSPRIVNGRSVGTAIYYLLTPRTFSAIHRLASDEIFHHYLGDAVEMLMLMPDGSTRVERIGKDIAAGESPQVVVPAGVWQGSRLVAGGDYALLGCTVAPGFDYADYEHGVRGELLSRYPKESQRITALTT
jgi:predicted cupin superfamily sugar epimerase